MRDLSARKQAEQHIRFLAHNDALTGLPNRVSFARKLEAEIGHARRHEQRFAVLCLDLDRFKEVNDLFGHAAGDTLLQRVGQALLGAVEGVGEAAMSSRSCWLTSIRPHAPAASPRRSSMPFVATTTTPRAGR